jgi:hypothetical protein
VAGLTAVEKQLLESVCVDTTPRLCVRSRLRIDAGLWWRRTPLWVCVTDSELVLLAVARRKYIEQVPLADCQASRYCAESGELALAPVEGVTFPRIRMSPRDALAVLREMGVSMPAVAAEGGGVEC